MTLDTRDSLRQIGILSAWAVSIVALIFAVVFSVYGAILAYRALLPDHPKVVCLASHDEEHSGNLFTLCDKRVPA